MTTSQTLLWITTFIMLLGGLAILLMGKRRTPSEELQTALHGIVPIIAACSYFAMATGQGAVVLPATYVSGPDTGRIFYFARYIDWMFTTPLLLISLAMTAMHAGRTRAGALVGIVLADVIMIATSLFFGASEIAWVKWTWFLVSCVAFLGVYYVIWVSLMQANRTERDDIRATYRRDATLLSAVWLLYPLVLLLSPDGGNLIGGATAIAFIAILDVLAKLVFGLMSVMSDAKATERDLREPATKPSLAPS